MTCGDDSARVSHPLQTRREIALNIVTISGSPSSSSRLAALLAFVQESLAASGLSVDWINVRELPAVDLVCGNANSAAIQQATERVRNADAVIVGTPVYKASYTGLLKSYLDLLPMHSFEGKVVLPLAIGGTQSHLLALDYALKPLLAVLGATHILRGVFALERHVVKKPDGSVELDNEIAERLSAALVELVADVYNMSRTVYAGGGTTS